jgi:hypothetical protein
VCADLFRIVNVLSHYLQKSTLDYCRAKALADVTVIHLKERKNPKHAELYFVETGLKCEKMGITQPELPRIRTLPRLL